MLHVFDAYGTLLDVHAPVRRLADRLGPRADALAALWRAKHLEYTWVRTLGGFPWKDFRTLAGEALTTAMRTLRIDDRVLHEELIALYDRLEAHPEVPAALTAARRRGARLAVLSNGTHGMLREALSHAGLIAAFDAVLSVDDVRRFKTAPEVYALVDERLSAGGDAVTFYSSNRWDVAAARGAGWRVVWVDRAGQPDEYPDLPPHAIWPDLTGLGA